MISIKSASWTNIAYSSIGTEKGKQQCSSSTMKLFLHLGITLVLWRCVTTHHEMEVTVSRGVIIQKIPNVILYTEEQPIHFFIPDLPDLPLLTSFDCTEKPFTESCDATAKLNEINQDSLTLLTLLSKMLTKNGLQETEVEDVTFPEVPIVATEAPSEQSEPPSEKAISAAGENWFRSLKHRLQQRRLATETAKAPGRTERSIGLISHGLKGLTAVAAAFGADDLLSFTSNLFVGKDKILNILTSLAAYMPVDRRQFAEVIRKTSEFESFSKNKFAEITRDSKDLKNLTQAIEEEIRNHRLDITVIQDGYAQTQRVLADVTTLLFSTILYSAQLNSFQVCRSKELPLLYVPPDLLRHTLTNLQNALPADIEFSIPLGQTYLYYTMSGLCNCLYDDDGGTIRLSVPLKTRGTAYQLFETKPVQFAWQNHTCVLELDASYIIREKHSNFVYPVTSVDSAACDPINSFHCKVPGSTNDDTTSSCVSLILAGATTQEIKDGCPIKCSKHNKPEISKVSDFEFVGTHILPNTLNIYCPSENRSVTEEVEYGALFIALPCGCSITFEGRVIGRSTKTVCHPSDMLIVETMLPVHYITSKDIIHFTEQDKNVPRYRHKDEIFNPDFLVETHPDEDDSIVTTKLNVYSVTWNAIQSVLLAYSFFRMHTMGALVFQLSQGIQRVHASTNHTCKLPQDAYILLIAVLVVSIVGVIPQMVFFIWKIIMRIFWETVEMEAYKMKIKEDHHKIDKEKGDDDEKQKGIVQKRYERQGRTYSEASLESVV